MGGRVGYPLGNDHISQGKPENHRLKSTLERDMLPPRTATVSKGCVEKNNYLRVMLGDTPIWGHFTLITGRGPSGTHLGVVLGCGHQQEKRFEPLPW